MGLTGDNRVRRRVLDPSSGETLGMASASRTDSNPSTATMSPKSRPGLFGSITRLTGANPPQPADDDDDDLLLDLDLEAALFPHNSAKDPFSPAAFKNLQLNALGVLYKFQHAYRRRTDELRALRAEHEGLDTEREEATLRAQHFKLQLEDMGRKAAEQEQATVRLMEELAAEKERKMRSAEEISMVMSEDLGFDDDARRQKWRKSTISFDEDSDSLTDEAASVFSQARSPIMGSSMTEGLGFIPECSSGYNLGNITSSPKTVVTSASRETTLLRPKLIPRSTTPAPASPQMTTFQKLFRGISGDSTRTQGGYGCTNCQGRDSSVAWDTVSLLRDENKGLKRRVEELETGVGAALDLVNGVGL